MPDTVKPLGVYALRPEACHALGVFELSKFKTLLREQREARVGGRNRLEELSGVNRTTIQNIETGDDEPRITTIAKLIEAMPGLSLSAFFLQLETAAQNDLSRQSAGVTSATLRKNVPATGPPARLREGSVDVVTSDAHSVSIAQVKSELLIAIADSLLAAATDTGASARPAPSVRPPVRRRPRSSR
jgi:DNA-binding XRE family transcriptional regulator